MKKVLVPSVMALACGFAMAKLPPPDDAAKAKAAETAAKAAWQAKLDAFQLCKAQDKVAAAYAKNAKAAPAKPAAAAAPAAAAPAAAPPAAPVAFAPPAAAAAAAAAAQPASGTTRWIPSRSRKACGRGLYKGRPALDLGVSVMMAL